MPTFRGKEIDEIRSWAFSQGEDLHIVCGGKFQEFYIMPDRDLYPYDLTDITRQEAEHALRVLGCISGAFKTQGESNT